MNWDSMRLATLSLPAKLLVTLFLLIIGPGYLFGTANIMLKEYTVLEILNTSNRVHTTS